MVTLTREQFLAPPDPLPDQTAVLGVLAAGPDGIAQTLGVMIRYVKQYRKDKSIRALAESIIAGVTAKDSIGECRAVFNWVRDSIRYTMDVRDVETLKTPDAVVFSGQGDCDDKSTLVSTLLESIGYATRFVAMGYAPNVFEHVYAQVKLGARWISMDTTENVSFGWEPPNPVAVMIRHI